VELVDLPVSQIMAKMEDEFGANDGQFAVDIDMWASSMLVSCWFVTADSWLVLNKSQKVVVGLCGML